MASTIVVETVKARRILEATERLIDLVDEPSAAVLMSRDDVVARQDPLFVTAALISELTSVVAEQQERIEALEAGAKADAKAKRKRS